MRRFLRNSLFFLLKLAIVLIINFIFFLIIPLTHSLLKKTSHDAPGLSRQSKILAEYTKPPKKEEEKEFTPRIRRIQTSPSGFSSQKSLSFKFTPDLMVAGMGESGVGAVMTSDNLDAVVYEEGEVDENARPLNRPPIPYPQKAKEMGIQGDLLLILLVNIDGRVGSVEVVSSPDQSITKAAQEFILSNWKFKPARKQGITVRQWVKQKISFNLN